MATILDQSYTTGQDNPDSIGNLRRATNNTEIIYQSFTPTYSGTLPQFDFYLKRIGTPSGNIWCELWSSANDSGSQIGGDSDTVAAGSQSTSYGFITFTWSSNVPEISSGTKYWMRIYGDYALSSSNGIVIGVDTTSPSYAGGNYGRYGDGGANWDDTPTYDCLFKQYVIPSPSGGAFLFFV